LETTNHYYRWRDEAADVYQCTRACPILFSVMTKLQAELRRWVVTRSLVRPRPSASTSLAVRTSWVLCPLIGDVSGTTVCFLCSSPWNKLVLVSMGTAPLSEAYLISFREHPFGQRRVMLSFYCRIIEGTPPFDSSGLHRSRAGTSFTCCFVSTPKEIVTAMMWLWPSVLFSSCIYP
jgi:hypothetical protein